jgi:hypothetical protein
MSAIRAAAARQPRRDSPRYGAFYGVGEVDERRTESGYREPEAARERIHHDLMRDPNIGDYLIAERIVELYARELKEFSPEGNERCREFVRSIAKAAYASKTPPSEPEEALR